MESRERCVYQAKLAEQAERYDGKFPPQDNRNSVFGMGTVCAHCCN